MSPVISHLVKRPSMIEVTSETHSLLTGSACGVIHMVFLPCHVPTDCARCSCWGPGVAACMHACISASVMPGGSCGFPSGGVAAGACAGVLGLGGDGFLSLEF